MWASSLQKHLSSLFLPCFFLCCIILDVYFNLQWTYKHNMGSDDLASGNACSRVMYCLRFTMYNVNSCLSMIVSDSPCHQDQVTTFLMHLIILHKYFSYPNDLAVSFPIGHQWKELPVIYDYYLNLILVFKKLPLSGVNLHLW